MRAAIYRRILISQLLAGVLTGLVGTLSASAQPTEPDAESPFDTLIDGALAHYERGEYLQAVHQFQEAYRLRARPELVYNIARAYEKALLPERSIQEYERFLSLQGTTAQLRNKALESLAALKQEREARIKNEQRKQKTVLRKPSVPSEANVTRTSELRSAPIQRLPEILLLGAGVAAASTGAVFGVLALDSSTQLENARTANAPLEERQRLSDQASSQALAADILIAAGAASAVSGLILLFVRGRDKVANNRLGLVPSLELKRGGVGVRLSRTF